MRNRYLEGMLCVITASAPKLSRDHEDVAQAAVTAGAGMIQLRDKNMPDEDLISLARTVRELTREAGALFIVNDRVDAALAAQADGVHVGQDDEAVFEIRGRTGKDFLIGVSVSSEEEALAAEKGGADYIGAGPIYATGSKDDAGEPIGLPGLRTICEAVDIPVLAIGGIGPVNAGQVRRAGAAGIAVISAVTEARDMAEAVIMLREACEI